jgi:AcrR family transcriptional regulator
LDATERLVYAGGICATGMDRIVRASGMARKSIYRLYPTKEALVAAALEHRHERWMQRLRAETAEGEPAQRLLAVFAALRRWFGSGGFHGCAFVNATGETGDPASPIRAVARRHKHELLEYLRLLVADAGLADADAVARQLLVLVDGAIAVALVSGDPAAADDARDAARILLSARGIPASRLPD